MPLDISINAINQNVRACHISDINNFLMQSPKINTTSLQDNCRTGKRKIKETEINIYRELLNRLLLYAHICKLFSTNQPEGFHITNFMHFLHNKL
jgi:hypothetical protein